MRHEKFTKGFIIMRMNEVCQTTRDFFNPYCDYTQGVYDGLMCLADDFGISYERGETTCRFFDSEANND